MKMRFRTAKVKTGIFTSKEVLVLQVLRKYKDGPNDHNGLPTYLAGEAWGDAKVEDLIELNLESVLPPIVGHSYPCKEK